MDGSVSNQTPRNSSQLANLLISDVADIMQIYPGTIRYQLLKLLGKYPAIWITKWLEAQETSIAQTSFSETMQEIVRNLPGGCQVHQIEPIPLTGSVLIASNHPGISDSLILLSITRRNDTYIVSEQKAIFEALPHIRQHLIPLGKGPCAGRDTICKVVHHLQEGSAVIIFPRGSLEPDPALIPGALNSLQGWSKSVGIFLCKAPQTVFVPVLIGKMVSQTAWQSLFARLARSIKKRQQFAMFCQFLMNRIRKSSKWQPTPKVIVGQGVEPKSLSPTLNPNEINLAIQGIFSQLLKENYPVDQV